MGPGAHANPVFCGGGSDPHFLRVPCWKVALFVLVPVLGPLLALVICYNWLHRRLAGAVGAARGASQRWGDPDRLPPPQGQLQGPLRIPEESQC